MEIRATFDFLGDKNILPHTVLNILYAQMFESELNEDELDDDDELYDLLSVAACDVLTKKIPVLTCNSSKTYLAEPCAAVTQRRYISSHVPHAP